jgi:eukaryotic-like serine/threonine-protein kinase
MKICPECKTEYPGGEVFCPNDGSRLFTHSQLEQGVPDDFLVGQTFDKYRVVRRIGEGGMGLVYEAVHTVIEKRVAMKVLRDDFSRKPEVVERFQLEAKSASRIGHENIVDISDFGTTPTGASYFVMEFLEGEDLATRLEREGTLSPEATVKVLVQCCAALGAAHQKGIVHRDMKPENIYLTKRAASDAFVKIVDFGIAKMSEIETEGEPGRKLTKTGMIFGTPEYMSPEQAAGKSLDHRVDIYALGVILFECLTGRVPFVGDSFMGILTQHMFDELPSMVDVNPNVVCPPALEAVLTRAVMKDPAARYQTTQEMADDLLSALEGSVGRATFDTYERARVDGTGGVRVERASAASPPPKRRTGLWVALAVLGLAGAAGAGVLLMNESGAALGTSVTVEQSADALLVAEPDEAKVEPEKVEPDPEPSAPEPSPDAEDEPVAAAKPALVGVRVETVPVGAQAAIEGTSISCSPTPCELETRAGEEITISAVRGRAVGKTVIAPEGRTTVQILLTEPKRAKPTVVQGKKPNSQGGRGDDLKIPDIFR